MQEDRRGESRLARLVARDRVEVGADHRRVAVHVADARQPFAGGCASRSIDQPLIRSRIGRCSPAVFVADMPIRATDTGVGAVAEELEPLTVPGQHAAERERSGRCRTVTRPSLAERSRAVPAQPRRHRRLLALPYPARRVRDDLQRRRRGIPRVGRDDHELPSRRMSRRQRLGSCDVTCCPWRE